MLFVVGSEMVVLVEVVMVLVSKLVVIFYVVLLVLVLCLVLVLVVGNVLEMQFSGDSWVDIGGLDGSIVEKVLIKFGEICSFMLGQVIWVILGNVLVVQVQQNGVIVDLIFYQ